LCTVHTTGTSRRTARHGTLDENSGNRLWTWTTSGRWRSIARSSRRASDTDHTASPAWRSFCRGVVTKTLSLSASWGTTSTPAASSQAISSRTARFSPEGFLDEYLL
jgi:hypothetical protein